MATQTYLNAIFGMETLRLKGVLGAVDVDFLALHDGFYSLSGTFDRNNQERTTPNSSILWSSESLSMGDYTDAVVSGDLADMQ